MNISSQTIMKFPWCSILVSAEYQREESYDQTQIARTGGKRLNSLNKFHWKLLVGWLVFLIAGFFGFIGVVFVGSARTARAALFGMILMTLAFFLFIQYAFPLMGI